MELSSSLASCWFSPATRNIHPEWHNMYIQRRWGFIFSLICEVEYALMSLLSGLSDPLAAWRGIHLKIRTKPSSAMHSLQPRACSWLALIDWIEPCPPVNDRRFQPDLSMICSRRSCQGHGDSPTVPKGHGELANSISYQIFFVRLQNYLSEAHGKLPNTIFKMNITYSIWICDHLTVDIYRYHTGIWVKSDLIH